jgi:hypothetical protein
MTGTDANHGTCGMNKIVLTFVLTVFVTMSCAMAVVDREKEVYLQGTAGPYRGRVVDARTKEPIRGAVVVAAWYYDVYAVVQTNEQFHDAIEVLTDDRGHFVVDASEIERRAPSRTKFPVFTVFKLGYAYYRGWFGSLEDMARRKSKALLGVVELEPNAGRGRTARLRNSPPHGDVPPEKMPNLLGAEREELEALQHERLP